ncbi:MAG: hypothetical protein LVR00_01430 [Rhabdochlamydiaceae bacterium]|jgi:serine/threonine protein kinase
MNLVKNFPECIVTERIVRQTGRPVTMLENDDKRKLGEIKKIFNIFSGIPNMPKIVEIPLDGRFLVIDRLPMNMYSYLSELTSANKSLPRQSLLRIMRQILDLIKEINAKGYCDVDLNLNNLGFDPKTECVVIINPKSTEIGKESGNLKPLRFQAPEILLGNRPSPEADVWSVAVLFFELITGTPLFRFFEMGKEHKDMQVNQLLHSMRDLGPGLFTIKFLQTCRRAETYFNSADNHYFRKGLTPTNESDWEDMHEQNDIRKLSDYYLEPDDWKCLLRKAMTNKSFSGEEIHQMIEWMTLVLRNSDRLSKDLCIVYDTVFSISTKNEGFQGVIKIYEKNKEQLCYFLDMRTSTFPDRIYLPNALQFRVCIKSEEGIKEDVLSIQNYARIKFSPLQITCEDDPDTI